MYEKLELERLKLQAEQMKYESERNNKEIRFRCLEIARNFLASCDNATLLQDAKKFLEFVEAK
jgi:hypothetical protein